ncbi:hypothetical protein [Pseudomonas sp. Pse35]|uniref:hypothetical protein n=1 Tax=Pseudomonas sp. Pse35 TaxID=2926021 RepID=UPI0021CA9583|nr:hypothetical protein [Pseudomonas sp. Pse35]
MNAKEINYQLLWAKCVDDQDEAVRKLPRSNESYDSRLARMAFGIYKLHCFCERLATKYASPWLELKPVEAGRLYALNKHHWHPSQVKELNLVDLLVLLHEELIEMKLTKEEFDPVHNWAMHMHCYPELAKSATNP